jgi:uncharacterized protein
MDFTGLHRIAAPREVVWNALFDPECLKACLPGCESVERSGDDAFKVVIKTAIGPLRARFEGLLRIAQAQPPGACTLHFEGQGGAVGFGKGSSSVTLVDTPDGTELAYVAKAQVGGKLAQVGSRLVDSVARKMADDFFKAFCAQLAPAAPLLPAPPAVAVVAQVAPPAPAAPKPLPVAPRPMVPAWWLVPAALIGALIAIAGARLIH